MLKSTNQAEVRAEAETLPKLYREAARIFGSMPAFATRRSRDRWEPISYEDLYTAGMELATGLIDLGVEFREHVGLLGDNRVEWILADYAVQLCGAADVPRGRDITEREIRYILDHAGVRVVFVETAALRDQVLEAREDLPDLREIVVLDPKVKEKQGTIRMEDLRKRGKELREEGDRRVEERIDQVEPEDLFTLIYTSGTTGTPKGVMLTHTNIISQLRNIPLEVTHTDRIVSILPVWHIFERVFEMLAISRGCCTYYTSTRTLSDDIANVAPTFMGSAPRLWENIHERILKRVRQQHPVRRALFHTAYFLSHLYKDSVFYLTRRRLDERGEPLLKTVVLMLLHGIRWALLLAPYGFFNAAVLERLRMVVGGAFKGSVSGGGALPVEVDQFFNYIGIPVLEGYGLTETAPVIAVRTPRKLVIGAVGPVIPETEIRIVSLDSGKTLYPDRDRADMGRGRSGEIVVRGPQVMKGYYKDKESTGKALRDGWMHTGDIGMITFNDCLKIVGRCKETIVLSSGENVEPAPIEMALGRSPLIEQCIVIGQDRRFLAALVVPSLDGFASRDLEAGDHKELAGHRKCRELLKEEIRKQISSENGFKSYERIREFEVLTKPFEVGEELTNLFKIKRHVVSKRYRAEIEQLYEVKRPYEENKGNG